MKRILQPYPTVRVAGRYINVWRYDVPPTEASNGKFGTVCATLDSATRVSSDVHLPNINWSRPKYSCLNMTYEPRSMVSMWNESNGLVIKSFRRFYKNVYPKKKLLIFQIHATKT